MSLEFIEQCMIREENGERKKLKILYPVPESAEKPATYPVEFYAVINAEGRNPTGQLAFRVPIDIRIDAETREQAWELFDRTVQEKASAAIRNTVSPPKTKGGIIHPGTAPPPPVIRPG